MACIGPRKSVAPAIRPGALRFVTTQKRLSGLPRAPMGCAGLRDQRGTHVCHGARRGVEHVAAVQFGIVPVQPFAARHAQPNPAMLPTTLPMFGFQPTTKKIGPDAGPSSTECYSFHTKMTPPSRTRVAARQVHGHFAWPARHVESPSGRVAARSPQPAAGIRNQAAP